jgi:uncharacterized protein YbbC (DUF1343 family)
MMTKNTFLLLLVFCFPVLLSCQNRDDKLQIVYPEDIKVGAERTDLYFPSLKNKNVAVLGNHTSFVGQQHLVDTLLSSEIRLVKVFSPEHGFRGKADAGAIIEDGKDKGTGLPIVSLYGKHKKPTAEDLAGIEIVVFDIQDVGARFYTYISTLAYLMEACAENNISVLILDRPNPNGHFVDGPILDTAFKSFVGMHPIPVVHGMTMGEYAQMINGEGWLKNGAQCDLEIIKIGNYDHHRLYQLPINPSPNLRNMNAIYLYPSLCFFEGTNVSIGRGTEFPFEIIGHPDFNIGSYLFTPKSGYGAKYPKLEGMVCYGTSLINYTDTEANIPQQLDLHWLLSYFDYFKGKSDFFIPYFEKLAGTDKLRKQIEAGLSEDQIRQSWQEDLNRFKKTREKYLLYAE